MLCGTAGEARLETGAVANSSTRTRLLGMTCVLLFKRKSVHESVVARRCYEYKMQGTFDPFPASQLTKQDIEDVFLASGNKTSTVLNAPTLLLFRFGFG